jgi:hypothetical protein
VKAAMAKAVAAQTALVKTTLVRRGDAAWIESVQF